MRRRTESVAYCGKSQIISAGGAIAAIASQDLPAVLTATIEIGVARATRPPLSELRSPHAPAQNSHAMRVAISASDWRDADIDERLRVLEAQSIVMPRGVHGAAFSAVTVCDEQVFDPGYLAAQRLSGFDAAVWRSQSDPEWQVTFARARALELKMYLIVIDASRGRAFAAIPTAQYCAERSTAIASPRFRTIRFARNKRSSHRERMCAKASNALPSMQCKHFAAALAVAMLLGTAPRTQPPRTGTFSLAVPSGPLISGSRVPVNANGFSGPFSVALLGPGTLDGHQFLAPLVDAATTTTLIAAGRNAVAYGTLRIVPPPAASRALLAVATYDNGVALHDPKTFALLGYAPIGGAPGDVAFGAGGALFAPDTDSDTLARFNRSPWRVDRTTGVPLGNEIAYDARTGAAFVTNRDTAGAGVLTRIAADGSVTRVRTGMTAEGLALDSRHGIAYVGNVNDDTVAAVDMRTMRVLRVYKSVARTFGIALDDESRRLFVVSNVSPTMPGRGGHVAAIDLHSGRIVRRSAKFTFPLGIALDAKRRRLFVTDEGKDEVYVLRSDTLTAVRAPMATCETPWRPRIAGDRLYVPCARANRVDVFDLRTLRRISGAPFATGGFPLSVALWP